MLMSNDIKKITKNHMSFIKQLKDLSETLDSELRKELQNLFNL